MKSKKGFTLAEMAVALAISAIAFSMLFLVLASVNGFVKNKQFNANLQTELLSLKTTVLAETEKYQSYSLQNPNGNALIFENGAEAEIVEIRFENGTLFANQTELANFEIITNVWFEANNSLIKCNVLWGDRCCCVIILEKR